MLAQALLNRIKSENYFLTLSREFFFSFLCPSAHLDCIPSADGLVPKDRRVPKG
jgi:hypothetical protein